MMSSTEEIKDAVRLAQQYNIHIYRTLINGIVDSSILFSKLKIEFEEYTRYSMEFFDRLYQISDDKIPFACVREEQIRVFIEQVKRNDILRQEVHSIVQRSLWNMRVMGQSVPMAKKQMIEQGFPELCVTTRSDRVPLTVLCDHVMHKYNLRNERHIVAMLKLAEEEISSRTATNHVPKRVQQRNKIFPSSQPTMFTGQPVKQDKEMHGMTSVNSNEDIRRQPVECFAITAYTQFHTLTETATTYTDPNPVEQLHDLTQYMSLADDSQQHADDFIMSFNDIFDLNSQQINKAGSCINQVIIKEIESVPETKPTSTTAEMFDDVMSVLQDIPELDSDYVPKEAASISNLSVAKTTNFDTPILAMRNAAKINVDNCLPLKKQENVNEFIDIEHIKHTKYDPRNRQVPLLSWEELMNRFTKPSDLPKADSKDITRKLHLTEPSNKPVNIVEKCTSMLNSNGIRNIPKASPIPDHVQNKQKPVIAKFEGTHKLPNTTILTPPVQFNKNVTSQVQKPLANTNQLHPLIGSDRPHVYKSKVNRQQHRPIKNDTKIMTPAETVEFKKKREEQIRALELTKEKTKNILNLQIGKSGREKSAIHYHKVVKVQDTVPKVGKVFKTPTSSGPSPQTTPAGINVQQAKQDKYVPSFISRKRPAAPSNPLSPSKRARRRLEPRIILRIFKDNNEWNVEQETSKYVYMKERVYQLLYIMTQIYATAKTGQNCLTDRSRT